MRPNQLLALLLLGGGALLLFARRAQAQTMTMELDATTGAFVPPTRGTPLSPFAALGTALGTLVRPRPVMRTTAPGNAPRVMPAPAGPGAVIPAASPWTEPGAYAFPPAVASQSVSQDLVSVGTTTGTAAAGSAAFLGLGPWAWTGIGAGAGLLTWGVWKKGLFRGGEEALHVNPARDQYLLQFGPPGTGDGSGFHTLAATLTNLTQEDGGGMLFRALIQADSLDELTAATRQIDALLFSALQNGELAGALAG